jgi:phosphohistidine phosphatase
VATHRLVLIRHAKTELGSPDEKRQLTDRGRRDAVAIGAWLRAKDFVPDLVVVSPATRARQTWELTRIDAPVTVDQRVYDNSLSDLSAVIGETDESVSTLAVVGHNPSIEAFAVTHGGVGEISTATVAVFNVDDSWADGEIRCVEVNACRG